LQEGLTLIEFFVSVKQSLACTKQQGKEFDSKYHSSIIETNQQRTIIYILICK